MNEQQAPVTGGGILATMGGFRPACLLGAAAELDLIGVLAGQSMSAEELAAKLDSDLRATTMLLDAIAGIGLLGKDGHRYSVPDDVRPLLTHGTPQTVLPMVLHSMTVLRNWSQLAWVVKAGIPGPRQASIRGFEADRAAFIAAMHSVSGPIADGLVAKLVAGGMSSRSVGMSADPHGATNLRSVPGDAMPPGGLKFQHLLDLGGASGTWTLAFLRAVPGARATIFDLPDAIVQARQRIGATELADRVDFVAGDFYRDELPAGADFAWVSAIIHQHAREDSRGLFAKVFRALEPGGRIGIRDIVMEPCRTRPLLGALFAINMLVATERGGTYTFQEIAEDLQAAGFTDPELRVKAEDMTSVVTAAKPVVGRL
jgi:SAM-dependent methyltransferase